MIQKTKVEVWEIVLKYYDLPHLTYGGLFCIIRKRNLITWGEWYYLHDVMSRWEKTKWKHPNEDGYVDRWSAPLIKKFIKKLKQNGKN